MKTFEELYNEIKYESGLTISESDFENMLKNLIIPSFNRDFPNVRAIIIKNKKRFYPRIDLTGYDKTMFISPLFLIQCNPNVFNQLKGNIVEVSFDIFKILEIEILKKIIKKMYNNSSFIYSPPLLFDVENNEQYYELNENHVYILIYNTLNIIKQNEHNFWDTILFTQDYKALKQYSIYKIMKYILNSLDMSVITTMNNVIFKLSDAIQNTDKTELFNPAVSSLSFGGEISISFARESNTLSSFQNLLPTISNNYRNLRIFIEKNLSRAYNKFNKIKKNRYLQLYLL